MADPLFIRGQAVATRLLNKYSLANPEYLEPGAATGPAWNPSPGAPIPHKIGAVKVAGKVKNAYIAGGSIVATDLLVCCEKMPVIPTMAGTMRIDGKEYQIVMLDPATLDESLPVRWYVGCRS